MTFHSLRSLRVLLVAAALLVAQWVLVQHEVQIEAHAGHTSCEWCLSHAPLSGGPLTSAAPVPAATAVTVIAEVRISPLAGKVWPVYQTRAPPVVLPV